MNELNDPLFRVLFIGGVLTLPLKAYCLWKSARYNQRGWFIALLLINTIGLLEVTYLFYFSKPKSKE